MGGVNKAGLLLTLFVFIGCATSFDARGKFHRVQSGETLELIARSYRVDLQDLAEENDIQDSKNIAPGQKLYLPPRSHKKRFKKLPFERVIAASLKADRRDRKKSSRKAKPVETYHGEFQWPVQGRVLSGFGIRNGRRHDGIDIAAVNGSPIRSAGDGTVVYAGKMRGYGRLILVKHAERFFTAYAHNSANLKKVGDAVKQGDVIGKVGMSGRATGPHLHFEIREEQKARNPLFFLPIVR